MEQNKNTLLWIVIAVLLLLLFGGFGMGSYGMMGFGFGFGWLFMILFWGIIIWLAITLLNAASGRKDDALEILKKRYASGKISKNEYEEIKKELR